MGKLDGKIALITGGSEGIGLATAQRFVAEGAYVFITGRRQEALDAAVKQIGNKNITAIQADSSKLDQLDNLYKIIEKQKGKLDILFANAGIATKMPLKSITEKHYNETFDINVKGVLFTVQKALRILNNGSSIILNGSIVSSKGFEAMTIYSASKAAIRSFARCWSVDLKDRQIRVNVISPGPIETPLAKEVHGGEDGKQWEAAVKNFSQAVVLGRIGQPDEIAKAAVFLASADSSYITGIELFVDGGIAQI
jgi:NAD(P)-dependent dehydrogenase (short-subunit alcohol dehydrogenase family)